MPAIPKLILDTFCEVEDLLRPWAHDSFWDLDQHAIVPGAVYLIGRQQFEAHTAKIRQLVDQGVCRVILSNPAEGSETLLGAIQRYGVDSLARSRQILLIGGGDMESAYACLQYDSFLPKILDYRENLTEINLAREIFTKAHKPYKFLFLNGRMRANRKYLLERLRLSELLDQGLWSSLDQAPGPSRNIRFAPNGQDLMGVVRPVQYLDPGYEVPRYRKSLGVSSPNHFVKYDLFGGEWGEIYLHAPPYVDTYFSIVTETVFLYPHSFRTEKIWKPMAMGHPWICAANAGYYRDLRNLGFRTFDGIIDESFDNIDNNQHRIERIAQVVEDLCRSDLAGFLKAAEPVCKYNQQHLAEMRIQVREQFPARFFHFLQQHHWID